MALDTLTLIIYYIIAFNDIGESIKYIKEINELEIKLKEKSNLADDKNKLVKLFGSEYNLQTKYEQNKESYIEFFLYVILLVYAIAIFLIIFRTANNYKGSRFWSFSSKALVTINLLFSINFFIEVSFARINNQSRWPNL